MADVGYWHDLIQDSVARRAALSASCYHDPDFFALEMEHVLRPAWHAVARWDDLPEPGDYASAAVMGEPVLLVRDDQRRLRVFSRVCTHRAHILIEDTGNAQRFTCPYHRWSYDREGRLSAAPLMDDTPGFDRSKCGLPELRSAEWLGFLFVSLEPDASFPEHELAPLERELAPTGFAELETAGVLEFDSPWNWKVLVDNFMESYHHVGPHVESLQKTNKAQDTFCREDLDGPFSLLENPGLGENPSLRVVHVFPTLLMAAYDGMPIGAWYEMQIGRHDHFQLRVHMLASPDIAGDPEQAAAVLEAARQIHMEDIAVCDRVQRGLASRLWKPGPLNTLEGALARFQRHLADRIAE